MKLIGFLVVILLSANFVSAYSSYELPTKEEQDIFNQLLVQFQKLDVPRKDVSDVIKTFQKPLIVTFPCNANDTNTLVVNVVNTRLAKFDQNATHQDLVTGGTYTWHCLITTHEGNITIDCNNEIRLNPEILLNNTGTDGDVHQIENLVILYHELLHGQLMIDAIKSSSNWRHEVCNKSTQGTVDYSYADSNHIIINPLQAQFASELIELNGGKMITKEIKPEETKNGFFAIKVLNMTDYPQFASGVKVTLRATNIDNTTFSSNNNDVFLTGSLVNKTNSGMAWFYVFIKQQKEVTEYNSIPASTKRIAGLWSSGNASNKDFNDQIEYLIQQKIIIGTGNHSGIHIIPNWFKKTTHWWFTGEINDSTFVNSIQYLISSKIIS